MIVYSLVIITLLFAVCSILVLRRALSKSFVHSWSAILLAVTVAAFIYLYGTWVYLSVYCKYIFAAIFIMVLLAGLFRKQRKPSSVEGFKVVMNLIGAFVFGALSILYFTGTTGKPETVALQFPLKKGTYFVLQGGKGLPTNVFHYSYRGAVYAMDIVKLDKYGNRAKKIFSGKLDDYHIFNDTIYSPCDGFIVNVRNDNPDNAPPLHKRGSSNLNAIVIDAGAFYVFLGHLKKNSVMVNENAYVKAGMPLAQVGNSGFSLEPHLHIQVHKKTEGLPWYRSKPLYIEFDGRAYLLFETIRPRRVSMIP